MFKLFSCVVCSSSINEDIINVQVAIAKLLSLRILDFLYMGFMFTSIV